MAQPSYHGRFIWQELLSDNPEAVTGFYTRLFSWQARPMSPGSPYTMFLGGAGAPLAGAIRLSDEARAMGVKAHWLGYIGSSDVDATVARALGLGAKVLKTATDIPGVGRAAVLIDPQGARFGVYQPSSDSSGTATALGFNWNELAARDRSSALGFYEQLFGWVSKPPMDMGGGMQYQTFGLGGQDLGGMYTIPANSPMTPAWLPYAHHGSADQAAASAVAAGGKVCNGPMDVPGGGRIVQLLDPQGVMFAVHSMPAAVTKPVAATVAPAKAKAKPKAKAKAKPKARRKAKPKSKARPKTKPKTKSKARAKSRAKARPKARAKRKVAKPAARKPTRRPARKK